MKKLVIISHTEHQLTHDNKAVGWGPTVREVNYMAEHWEQVIHVACLNNIEPLSSSQPYTHENIAFIPIPMFGGKRWWQKMDILWKSPRILHQITRAIKGATEVQIRLPMGLGLILLPFFWMYPRKFKLWIKYANNWGQRSSSLSFQWQKFILTKNWLHCPVTINGTWPDQPKHCLSFENPCLTNQQIKEAADNFHIKKMQPPYDLIFIGRVDADKGIDVLIESIPFWNWRNLIGTVHIAGNGPLLEPLNEQLRLNGIQSTAYGFISQEKIHSLLAKCAFLLLPSKSEGFPKVVAEALNFGCIPVVSDVGSISHYIHDNHHGFIMKQLTAQGLCKALELGLQTSYNRRNEIAENGRILAKSFTFEAYIQKLKKEVLHVLS